MSGLGAAVVRCTGEQCGVRDIEKGSDSTRVKLVQHIGVQQYMRSCQCALEVDIVKEDTQQSESV